jgi:hypothetical protein
VTKSLTYSAVLLNKDTCIVTETVWGPVSHVLETGWEICIERCDVDCLACSIVTADSFAYYLVSEFTVPKKLAESVKKQG